MAEESEEKAWKSSFTEDGKTYAASIFWQPLVSDDNPLDEIKDAATNVLEGADLYVIRNGKSSQFGLAVSQQGFAKGIPSAAIALITSLENVTSFLGVFKVDTGWWYICFRNDVILSDGDTLFVNEKDAKDQFISMLSVPDWDILYAPKEWGIEDTKDAPLASLLNNGLKVKLERLDASNDVLWLGVLVISFVVIGFMSWPYISSMFFAPPEEPVVAPVEPVEAQVELPPEIKPWENLPNPVDIMKNCYDATRKVIEIVTPGWTIEGITCTRGGLVTSWKRNLGRMMWMEQALDVSGVQFSSRSMEPDGNTVMVTVPVGEVSTLNSPPEYSPEQLSIIMTDLNQAMDFKINNQQTSWVSDRGTQFHKMTFSTSSNNDPNTWLDFFTKFSGLTITEIQYDSHTSTWSYKGEIYEL